LVALIVDMSGTLPAVRDTLWRSDTERLDSRGGADEMRAIGTYALIARQGQVMASILSTW